MSEYYKGKRTRNIFDSKNDKPFAISRSKIDLFLSCPRCFYLDRRLGVGRPPGFPFNLNSAVDTLLKKEFDVHRAASEQHPLMEIHGISAIPFAHPDLDVWRENFKGVRFTHEPTNLIITGAVDDIWINENGELHIVDYKSTSKTTEVNLDAEWQIGYKRQMEVYQWLLRQNGFDVSNTGYFVYANGSTDRDGFHARLDFDMKVIPYTGDDSWVEPVLGELKKCLVSEKIPTAGADCDYCAYIEAVQKEV